MENKEELNAQELGKEKQELEQDMQKLNVDNLEKVSGSSWLGNIWNKIKSVE